MGGPRGAQRRGRVQRPNTSHFIINVEFANSSNRCHGEVQLKCLSAIRFLSAIYQSNSDTLEPGHVTPFKGLAKVGRLLFSLARG